MPRIGILVVAYNAETTLQSVLARIPPSIMSKIDEVFVFDDASDDRTHEVGQMVAREGYGTKLSVFKNPVNLMYGGNQSKGYQYAMERGLDIVVLLHGDGQYAPEVMQDLLTPLENGEADMVMGSRMMVKGAALKGNMPMYKYVGNKVLTWFENKLIGTKFTEFHSGYRAYSLHAMRQIPLGRLTYNWHFDTQIIVQFVKKRFRIKEVPIPTYYGDEICRVNGIPYAMHCAWEALSTRCDIVGKWREQMPAPGGPPTDMPHYRAHHHDPRSSHQQIFSLVQALQLSPILDVGAAQGMLGQSIQNKGLAIDGVELNAEWAEMARPYYRDVWASTVEAAPLPVKMYKLIVCGDVLEHTPDPAGVLKRLIEASTDDAKFIISLPNVAHVAVRLLLLFGRFPKMDRGILDRTHLHFFTRDTAQEMLRAAGLKVTSIRATGVPIDELWKTGQGKFLFRAMVKCQHLALAALPRVFGFQWVMLAERVKPV